MDPTLLQQISELLGQPIEDVTQLTLEDVRDLLRQAADELLTDDAAVDDDSVERAEQIVTALDQLAEAITEAERTEAERAERVTALRERIHPAEETPAVEAEVTSEATPDAEEVTPAEQPALVNASTEPVVPIPDAVAADAGSAEELPPPPTRVPMARRRPPARAPVLTVVEDAPLVTITAAAEVAGIGAGSRIPNLRTLGDVFGERIYALQGAKGDGLRVPVAKMSIEYPEDRHLRRGQEENNTELVQNVVSPQAITAAGGLCAPVAARYDLENVSVDDRPVRDSLARFAADRGGIRFISPPLIGDTAAGVDVITEVEDTASATKPCVTITCGSAQEVDVSAVYRCIGVGNFNRRFWPEQFTAWWALAGAQHAREAEGALLDAIGAGSTQVSDGQNLGAARDLLEANIRGAAKYRNTHRMSPSAPIRLMLPAWVRDMIAADLVREVPGASVERFATTDAQIDSWFRARNINVTWYMDTESGEGQVYASQGVGALLGWQTTVVGYMFHEGAWLFLDGGTLDLGIEIRDTTMNESNDSRAFMETFENAALIGVESLEITYNLCLSGASSLPIAVSCPEQS